MDNKKIKNILFLTGLILVFIGISIAHLFVFDSFNSDIILDIRLPRLICVAFIGASLSLCGVCMQSILQNPLADGSTLGVSSSSSLGAVIALVLISVFNIGYSVLDFNLLIVFSIFFACLSFFICVSISLVVDKFYFSNNIILIGVVISFFCTGLISFIITVFPENTNTIIFWTLGSVSGVGWVQVLLIVVCFLVCFFVIYKNWQELNVFSLGDVNAKNLGINIKRKKIILILCMSILIGVCVSIAGPIAFVGLICPHICRFIIGPNHKTLILFASIFGALFLTICDFISMYLIYPKQTPIGIITSFIGAIVFIVVFYRSSRVKNER